MTEELSYLYPNMLTEEVNSTAEKKLGDSDAENEIRVTNARINLKCVTGNDSDTDKENDLNINYAISSTPKFASDDSSDTEIFSIKKKSRIKSISNSSDNDSQSGQGNIEETNKYLSRTNIRNKKLHNRFKKLKQLKNTPKADLDKPSTNVSDDEEEANLSDGEISCSKIKQIMKKKSSQILTSICDPDTSEEETDVIVEHQKSKPRSIKLISPKPVRISAKEAMENMQKIKSESNRMLREREVSLPYHKPKALTLKDIMNRTKPALTSEGKSLPIKMNTEQLKQYALMLEKRQKEMMELCKSDTDEDEQNCPEGQEQDSINNINKFEDNRDISGNEKILRHESLCLSNANDKIFDETDMEHKFNDKGHNLNQQTIIEAVGVNNTVEEDNIESGNNYIYSHEKVGGVSESVKEKQENMKETEILHENQALSLNVLNNDSFNTTAKDDQIITENKEFEFKKLNKFTEQESQDISLHYNSEKTEVIDSQETTSEPTNQQTIDLAAKDTIEDDVGDITMTVIDELKKTLNDEFSDNDFGMDEIEGIIENAEVNKDKSNKNLPNIEATLENKPMLTGTPGMVIDLDDNGENTQKKLTGVELLKERFTYFARLKSLEDMEKDREKKFKPGIQHLKLKQELEEQIAEQRSLEWEKRLQIENQLKAEINEVQSGEFDGEEVEKIEAKLEENVEEEESSSEEEIEDADIYKLEDKPRKRNPMIDDEAEVSGDERIEGAGDIDCEERDVNDNDGDDDGENASEDDDEEESSESEEDEQQSKCRKGRILKAFEDSDDEDLKDNPITDNVNSQEICESQDDEIQLAQPQKTYSDDLFTSQESTQKSSNRMNDPKIVDTSLEDLGSQTFSIMKSGVENINDRLDVGFEKMDVICETQPCSDDNFEAIVGMCTGGFTENLVTPEAEPSQLSQSQEIGYDVTDLCTGKFYDNPFVSQAKLDDENSAANKIGNESINESNPDRLTDEFKTSELPDISKTTKVDEGENKVLKSILEELHDPEFDSPKPNKYFFNGSLCQTKENTECVENSQFKKKFVIESDDENNEVDDGINKKKKRKKRKLENRALQISDDEEDCSEPEQEPYESDIEEEDDRLVEYDSEENEVEIQTKVPKKKRAGRDFFEQEAELTSEDEWIGSGDEDEAGLDRMEREEGDDDKFHQGKLQRELGEIHMREVLDQDKREVRLLQELLFEDGDLGDGHRQRKFRWKNADGEEELGTNADEYADTQDDEFESEEQWRKQRHEREMFLRKLQEKDEADKNITINRSALIKAKLTSKPASGVSSEKQSNSENCTVEHPKSHEGPEKRIVSTIPSPKKPFILLKQNYHNSLLTRGRGALARLAALATPLAGDGDDTPKVIATSNRGNFVFAAITPSDTEFKAKKRKADSAHDSPSIPKKMKTDSTKYSKNSLLNHL